MLVYVLFIIFCIFQEIKPDNTIQATNYNSALKTKFIIPGYLETENEDWPQEMCKVI